MARQRDRRRSNIALAIGFGVLLVAVVGSRVWYAFAEGSAGAGRNIIALLVLALFVGAPAVYGLLGLVRDESGPDASDEAE